MAAGELPARLDLRDHPRLQPLVPLQPQERRPLAVRRPLADRHLSRPGRRLEEPPEVVVEGVG